MNVENLKSKRLDLPKLLFTSPGLNLPNGKYHFARCGGEKNIGREVLASFQTLKDKYGELLTWTEKQSLPIKVATRGVEAAFCGFLLDRVAQATPGSQQVMSRLGGATRPSSDFGGHSGCEYWTYDHNGPFFVIRCIL